MEQIRDLVPPSLMCAMLMDPVQLALIGLEVTVAPKPTRIRDAMLKLLGVPQGRARV